MPGNEECFTSGIVKYRASNTISGCLVIQVVLTIKISVICVGIIMCIKAPLISIVAERVPDMSTCTRTHRVTHLSVSSILGMLLCEKICVK